MNARIVVAALLATGLYAAACAGKTPEPTAETQQPVESADAGPSEIGEPTDWPDGGETVATSADAGTWVAGADSTAWDAGTRSRDAGVVTRDAGTGGRTTSRPPTGTTTRDAGVSAGISTVPGGTATAAQVAEPDSRTQRQWKSKCGSCHGADGKGATKKGKELGVADMTTRAYQQKSDRDLRDAIENGAKSKSGGEMEGFKGELSPEEIQKLVAYVRWLGKSR